MLTDKDNQIILYKENFKEFTYPTHYSMVNVDSTNYHRYESELKEISQLLKTQLPDWNEAPNYQDLEKRFESKSKTVLFLYNNNPIGWGWYNDNATLDWININKTLPTDWVYGGGLFVSKLVNRPKDAGLLNYNKWLSYTFQDLDYKVFCGYCHKWNTPAMRVHLENGLIIKDWY